MNKNELSNLVKSFQEKGGKVKVLPEGKADSIWTSTNILTKPPTEFKSPKQKKSKQESME
jgi:hypothetical protein